MQGNTYRLIARSRGWRAHARRLVVLVALVSPLCWLPQPARASDHADPIDLWGNKPREPRITDLFVFPVDADGAVVEPYVRPDGDSLASPDLAPRPELSPAQRAQIRSLVFVLCFRPQLPASASTPGATVDVEPYTYRIHMDLERTVAFDDAQMRLRYGGAVVRPEDIRPTVTIELRLRNEIQADGTLLVEPTYLGNALTDTDRIQVWAGVRDDPFIFPMFFKSNVLAVVLEIPITSFPSGQRDWIVWATSSRGNRQIDTVGRSSRTQNPRFDPLNTLPPSEHVAEIEHDEQHPSLMRDLFLRANIQSLFAFRQWDNVPDVMLFSSRFPPGFPNGRLLTDDVAAQLAQFGDTALLDLSYLAGDFPRKTTNDKPFLARFPYLAEPWTDPAAPKPFQFATLNKLKLIAAGLVLLVVFALAVWQVVRLVRSWLGLTRSSRPKLL